MFFVLYGISMIAQNKDIKVADKLFSRYEFAKAITEYQILYQRGVLPDYVSKQLGNSYYNMANTKEAEKWYSKAIQSKQDAETFYNYAQVLKSNGKYEQSDLQMKIFASMKPKDQRAIDFKKNPNYLSGLTAINGVFVLNKLKINSDKSDFGAYLFGNTLYFSSARNQSNAVYGWNDQPFLDIYQSNYKADGTFSDPTLVNELNTKYHEGPLTISKDGSIVYFSSESFKEDLFEKDKVKKLKFGQVNLFKAIKKGGKWTGITPLSFNSKSYSVSNPSIDSEGKILYFSSNMPGSVGGVDIWKVKINSDGSFGVPKNLGKKINTEGDESFPFIAENNKLYFSSNGLQGFGGLDVFSVDLEEGSVPVNMGHSINSEKDDFAFTFNKEKNIGFVSSNRSGEDNIYSVESVSEIQIIATVKNAKTKEFLADARVAVLDAKHTLLDSKMSNEKGQVLYDAEPNKQYVLEVRKDGYVTKSINVDVVRNGVVTVEIVLDPIDVIVTENEIILNPIYFRFDKSEVTAQGAEELDKLVYVMSQNNMLKIFIKSHTDSRGSDPYNLKLSTKRARATVDYIVSKGISADRISGKGFGESEPKVDCGEACTNTDHAINRRSEFIIVKK